jgi:N-methylhydantoinase A/oxoprolinase/acetone carboxylase beta subunit
VLSSSFGLHHVLRADKQHVAVHVCAAPLSLQAVLDSGISSIAVVLKHAAIYPNHENVVGQLAKEMGFTQVRLLAHLIFV